MTSRSEAPPGLIIVRGSEEQDEHCLHCVLWPIVSKFIKEHPDYQHNANAPMNMAHVIGELVGSGLYNSNRREGLDVIVQAIGREIHRSAVDLFQVMDKHRKG